MADDRPLDDLDTSRRKDQALEVLLDDLGRRSTAEALGPERWTGDCPDDVGLWHELAIDALDGETADALETHAASCPLCATERDLAGSFAAEVDAQQNTAPTPSAVVAETRPSDTNRSWRPALALAATLLLAVVGWLSTRTSSPDLPPVEGPGSGSTMRSGSEVVLVAPNGELAELPSHFSWNSTTDEAEFRVTVQRVDGRVLFERRTNETQLQLSPEERGALEKDVTYTWYVTANLGENEIRTTAVQFVVASPEPQEGDL